MKSSRLFYIVYRLLNGGPVTAPELARQLEVSVRTVYRDVEALCQAGVPVATEQGRGGGIRLMDGFVMSKAFVSAGEQDRLMLAVKSLASATGGRDGELVQKLGALFKRPAMDWLEVDLSRWGQGGDRDTRFDLIQQAILEKRLLVFSYAAAAGICRRRVKPARLCYKSSAWYLQGLCLSRGEYRTFKVNRMSALALADERFTEPLAPPPIEAGDGGPRRPNVVLRFSPRAAFRVYDEFGSESIRRDENGALIVTAGIPYTDGWLYGYLASFGGAAEVLSPPEARRGLALYAQRLYLRYQKDLTGG